MKVTFDTHIYRMIANRPLEEAKSIIEKIKEREREMGVVSLQNTFVLQELFKYLTENYDFNYDNCRDAVILSSIHCQNYEVIERKIKLLKEFNCGEFCANSELSIVKWVAEFLGKDEVWINPTIGKIMKADLAYLKMAHELTLAENKEAYLDYRRSDFKTIKSNLDELRAYFSEAVKNIYGFVDTQDGWKFPEDDKNKLKKLRAGYLQNVREPDLIEIFDSLMALSYLLRREVVKTFPMNFYRAGDIRRLDGHILPIGIMDKFVEEFEPFFNLFRHFNDTAIMAPANLANGATNENSRKRWNDFFDNFIIISAIANDALLVTEEKDIVKAYDDAGMRHKVMKWEEYLAYLNIVL